MIEVLKANPWRSNVDRVEVTPCRACPRRHVVAVDPTLYVRRPPVGTLADDLVIRALVADGWRLTRTNGTGPGWVCPEGDVWHGYTTLPADDVRLVVVEDRTR